MAKRIVIANQKAASENHHRRQSDRLLHAAGKTVLLCDFDPRPTPRPAWGGQKRCPPNIYDILIDGRTAGAWSRPLGTLASNKGAGRRRGGR